jgi:hypothetical protein
MNILRQSFRDLMLCIEAALGFRSPELLALPIRTSVSRGPMPRLSIHLPECC